VIETRVKRSRARHEDESGGGVAAAVEKEKMQDFHSNGGRARGLLMCGRVTRTARGSIFLFS